MSLRRGSSAPTAEGPDPHMGPRPPRVQYTAGRGPGAPRVQQARARVFRWKTGPPPHSMRVVEACSAAVARGVTFARSYCIPRITEVHSAVACAAAAQSPSAALNGYDCTTPFHHTAYAASYMAVQLRCRQRRKLHPGVVSTRQGMDMQDGGSSRTEQVNPGMRSPSPAMP